MRNQLHQTPNYRHRGIAQWLLLGVGVVGLLLTSGLEVQAQDWSVRNRSRRHQVVLRRFIKLVERNPTRGFAYKRMIQLARRSPGLDKLLARYKKKVRRSPRQLSYRLIYAHLLLTTRRKTKALRQYEAVIKRSPRYRLGHIYLGALYRDLQQYSKALLSYQRALKLSKKRRGKRQCLKAMGAISLLLKKPKQALKFWHQFLAISPRNIRAREELALAMARFKLYGEALKQWKEVLRRSRGSAKRARVMRKMGHLYEQWSQWQKAVTLYRKAMGYTRRGHWLRRELNERILQLHRENGKLKVLVAHLNKLKRKGRSELSMLARLLDELGRDKEAAVAYKKALRLNRMDTKLRQKYITLLEVLNRIPQAIQQYRVLIRIDPTEPRHRLSFAEMLSRVGKRKESLAAMRSLARAFSRNTEILNRLANLYRRRRMHKEALILYRRLIRVEPREPAHRRALGQYFYRKGEYKKALKVWQGILQSGMARHAAYSVLGQILRDHDLLLKARKWFQKAHKAKPKKLAYMNQLGELYQRILDEDGEMPAKWLKDAIRIWTVLYKKAKLRPRKKRALQQLFALYHAEGTLYRRPRIYRNRVAVNPRDAAALRWLGQYQLWRARRRGRSSFSQAEYYYKKILRIAPNDLDALLTLEQLASRRRYWLKASKFLRAAIKYHPKGRRGYYRRLCNYNLKMGRYQQAVKYGRKALALNPDDASAHADLARIYRRAKQPKRAIQSYREAIRLRPHSYSYYLALAELLRKHGSALKAAELYRHVIKNAKDGRLVYEAAIRAIDILHPLGRTKPLEGQLQTLADAHPRELAYFRALAELYKQQGRMKEYHVAYLKAAATVDQKSQVYKRLAEVAQEQGDLKKAIIYFRKMLEESPNPTARSQIRLADYYLQVSDNSNARKILLALLNEHPNSLRVLRQVASLFYQYNMLPDAIRAYELMLDLDVSATQIRLRLASLYRRTQQFDAAAGLLSELVWNQLDRPTRKRRKKKTKPGRKKKKRLPYYLRRRRYYRYRYRQYSARRKAMGELIDIYERLRMLNQWDRRILFALTDPKTRSRSMMLYWVIQHYRQRRWFDRLEKILKVMHAQEPRNRSWITHLADLYYRQNRFADALALYNRLEKINPRSRHYLHLQKIRLALGMKDRTRLDFFVRQFLASHQALNFYQVRRLLILLRQHNQHGFMEHVLKWSLSNGSRRYRQHYLNQLTEVYIKLGKRKQARMILWKAWKRKPYINRYTSIRSLINLRSTLLRRMWPLMNRKQRVWLKRRAEQKLMDLLLQKPSHHMKLALVDMYVMALVSRGEGAAQEYLPALWGMTRRSSWRGRAMRQSIMKDLLQQGKYKKAIALMRKGLARAGSSTNKLFYLRRQLYTLSRYGLLPPRVFSRFLERQLRKLRPKVSAQLWMNTALQLADRYLTWGNYRRTIWWIDLCRWISGPKVRKDPRFLLRLARAYQRKGNESLARRNFGKVVKHAWASFNRRPSQAYDQFVLKSFFQRWLRSYRRTPLYYRRYWQLYHKLKTAPGGWVKYLHRNRHTRYSYRPLSYRLHRHRAYLQRQHRTRIEQAAAALRPLYSLHVEASQRKPFFKQLHKAWRSAPKNRKTMRLYHLIAAYHLDWTKFRSPTSLHTMLKLLRRLLPKHRLPKHRQLHETLASLEAKAGNYERAIALYQSLLKILSNRKQSRRMALMRKIARIYGQAGQQKKQWRYHLRLSTQLRDGLSDRWLARYYLERNRLPEAIRYYRQYQRRGIRGTRSRSYRRRYASSQSQQHLNIARFLMSGGHQKRALYFLKRCLGTLRQTNRQHYSYRNTMHRAMISLLHIGQLHGLIKRWEGHKAQRPRDLHLLSMLHTGYQLTDQNKKVRATMEEMLAIRPYDRYLLNKLLNSYKRDRQYKKALAFLQKQYGTRSPKPRRYYLWLGKFHYQLKQRSAAFKAWDKQFGECQKQTSRYRKFYCRYALGQEMLEAGGIKQALRVFVQTVKQMGYYYSTYNYYIRSAAALLLKKKAYKETLSLVRMALSRRRNAYSSQMGYYRVLYQGLMIRAHKGLKQKSHADALMSKLESSTFSVRNAALAAARILENAGRLLGAERCYWRAMQKPQNRAGRKNTYGVLCSYWRRNGLNQMCDGEELKPSRRLDHTQRTELAQRLEKSGFPFLALLELRKLRLYKPNDPKLWLKLFELSLRVGRFKEAKLWLRRLKKDSPSGTKLSQLQSQLAQASRKPGKPELASHHSWAPLYVPGWCQELKVSGGRLKKQKCKSTTQRCPRHLLRKGKLLVTNDCRGHIVALHADTGKAQWVYGLPKLKEKEKLKTSGRASRISPYLIRFYEVKAIVPVGGGFLAAVNENWLENGYGWGSGVHVKLHLLRLNTRGKVVWKRKLSGDFVRGEVTIKDGYVALTGRVFRVLDAATGKTLWTRQRGLRYPPWLFGEKTPNPHVARSDGYVVAGHDRSLTCFDRKGKQRWRRKFPWLVLQMANHKDAILAISDDERLYALSPQTGKTLWQKKLPGGVLHRAHIWGGGFRHTYSTRAKPSVIGQKVLYTGTDGILRAFSIRSGRSLWSTHLGDHSPIGPQPDAAQKKAVYLGLDGTMSLLELDKGRIQWRYAFPRQMPLKRTTHRVAIETHTPPILGARHLWVGVYDELGRMAIHAFSRNPKQMEKRTRRLFRLVRQLQKERLSKMAIHVLTHAVDSQDGLFRDVFLRLARHRFLSVDQRLRWAYEYLATSRDPHKALAKLPKSLRSRSHAITPINTYYATQSQRKTSLLKLLLMLKHPRKGFQNIALRHWRRLLLSRHQSWMRHLSLPLGRRLLAPLLEDKRAEVRLMTSMTLTIWGDQLGRKVLLKSLKDTLKRSRAHIKQLRLVAVRLLLHWSSRYDWEGLALAQDVPALLPLMRDSNREIRLRTALFIGRLAARRKAYRKYITPRVFTLLSRATTSPRKQLAVLAAITMGRLGQRRGVLYLRRLFGQFYRSKRNEIARQLQNNFNDYWGRRSIFSMYHGKYNVNLLLPSFRIIYANLLLRYRQYNEALFHFQMMFKLSHTAITPLLRAMAYYGMGLCFFKLKRYKDSIAKFQQALKLDRFMASAQLFQARSYYYLKRYKASQRLLHSFGKHDPYNPVMLRYLALIHLQKDQAAKAQRLFDQAIKRGDLKQQELLLYSYVQALLQSPRPNLKRALKWSRSLLKRRENHPAYLFQRAKILYKLKRLKKARQALNEAIIQEAPRSPHRPRYIKLFKQWFKRTPRMYSPKL